MATMTTSARPERGWQCPEAERLLTGATVVTFVRTVASVGLALYAAYDRSLTLLLVALAVYWVGDMADGALARLTDTETRIGAVFDIVSDRLCAGTFYVGLVWLEPAMALPVGVFLLEFAVVDTFVSLAFLAWPLRSPNYFYLVDRPIWLANWSKPGKAANSSAVALLMVITHSVPLCTAVALCLLAVKVWSLVRLDRLGLPLPQATGSPNPAAQAGQAGHAGQAA
ncbi:CDP-alcohol phosphatidyltransferase family protein [Actinopolymorpha rutila]|uniref:CDP-diacylglycerol--glycerol-3-phosphate 3-phosphatidyltransferase n=1 Tax=Actinopolymorpha rutila TaxID=446787 RepID=A0A852ZX46_9ACTN|nr:CDP-alcohol phosphatidyltransferase family protein [Actinopolymorpha rutila]NYH93530.1 CDP-diacylglycerol--glycerol-3-phosphate 3-phosphatidyltransferase [Actinopolymorpha rutila]